MIVLNGEEFIYQSLASVYDVAHEIIVVDGATPAGMFMANWDSSSTDRTLEILNSFPDPQRKLHVITGKWADKNQQSNAYMAVAEGDYIWQLDCDEVYKQKDLETVIHLLEERRAYHVSFRALHFWHDLHTLAWGSWWSGREYAFHRVNKFWHGAVYANHRPPTIYYNGKPAWECGHITADELEQMGVYLYHYSHVTDKQVRQKMQWYANGGDWATDWYQRVWKAWELDPLSIETKYGTHPSNDKYLQLEKGYTRPFAGEHPQAMRSHPLWRREYGVASC